MQCLYPLTVKNPKTGLYIKVPCGRCGPCLINRSRDWCLRLQQELMSERTIFSTFLTLSYSPENVPLADDKMVLNKSDLQKYFKRVRKNFNFRYFAVGEYGNKSWRPHYHVILFLNKTFNSNGNEDVTRSVTKNSFYALLEKCWDLGIVYFGDVTPASINYVSFYILKESYDQAYAEAGLPAPFQLMSKRPFLGSTYVFDNKEDKEDYAMSHNLIHYQGSFYRIPRIFKDKLLPADYLKINDFVPVNPAESMSVDEINYLNKSIINNIRKHK